MQFWLHNHSRRGRRSAYVLKPFYHFHNPNCDTTSFPTVTTLRVTLSEMHMENEYPQCTAQLFYSAAMAISNTGGLELFEDL